MFEQIEGTGRFLAVIRSEDDAWRLLEHATSGGDIPERLDIRFDGWPRFDLKVDGKDWKSTVPTRIMGPLLEVQKDLHRNFVAISYGSANLKKMRDEDRESLEIIVHVGEGSSDFTADLGKQFSVLAEKAVEKMTSRQAVVTILGIATIVGTTVVAKDWIASRQNEVDAEVKLELSKQETARMQILADATRQQPVLKEAQADVQQSTNRLLKTLKPNDTTVIRGVPLKASDAAEITQHERARSESIDISGAFLILANDASRGDGFTIRVTRVDDNLTFSAAVPFELPADQKQLIQEAEWSKGGVAVHLEIEAAELRGSVVGARVLSARKIDEDPLDPVRQLAGAR